jgi:hypothetical protein
MKKIKEKVEDMSPYDRMFLALVNSTIAVRKTDFFQWQLARRMNVNGTLLSKYLRGRRPMPQDVKNKLIRALEIDNTLEQMSENREAV